MEPEEGAVVAVVEPEDVRGHPGSATTTIVDKDCKWFWYGQDLLCTENLFILIKHQM